MIGILGFFAESATLWRLWHCIGDRVIVSALTQARVSPLSDVQVLHPEN
ncbi:hypothetical protein [uncultured Helicobacter sp.]|nr:hypothetical protein [uncultured Helicobacter sp.]